MTPREAMIMALEGKQPPGLVPHMELIGNVNCGLLKNGTDAEVIESARYALKSGMPGGGYIFGTSNCIYTGMPLERYELMLKVRREEGVYAAH